MRNEGTIMNIQIKENTIDRSCNYCRIPEHRENFDGRKFYDLCGDRTRMIVCICENCARELYVLLSELVDRNGV